MFPGEAYPTTNYKLVMGNSGKKRKEKKGERRDTDLLAQHEFGGALLPSFGHPNFNPQLFNCQRVPEKFAGERRRERHRGQGIRLVAQRLQHRAGPVDFLTAKEEGLVCLF